MGPRSVDRGNGTICDTFGRDLGASMGPRSVDRGNSKCESPTLTYSQLQWGRDLLIAETDGTKKPMSEAWLASMGPRSVDRGNDTSTTGDSCLPCASMGPRSVDRGNLVDPTDE